MRRIIEQGYVQWWIFWHAWRVRSFECILRVVFGQNSVVFGQNSVLFGRGAELTASHLTPAAEKIIKKKQMKKVGLQNRFFIAFLEFLGDLIFSF